MIYTKDNLLVDMILVKENSTELIIRGEYDNNISFFINGEEIYPSSIKKIWRLDFDLLKYVEDSYRVVIEIDFEILELHLNNTKIDKTNFKNLKKGKYEYHKYNMYLDENKIFIHKWNRIRRR